MGAANPQIPVALLRVLVQPPSTRNALYSTRTGLRNDMERLAGSLRCKMNESEDAAVPGDEPVDPFNEATEERDSLGISVSRVKLSPFFGGGRA